jgi:hypothetical protein
VPVNFVGGVVHGLTLSNARPRAMRSFVALKLL